MDRLFNLSFWQWWPHVGPLTWSSMVVLSEPVNEDDLSLSGCVEPLGIQDFSAKCSFETLVVTVPPIMCT